MPSSPPIASRRPRSTDAVAAGTTPPPDFVVWPENSTAVDPFEDAEIGAGIRAAVVCGAWSASATG